MFTSTDKVNLYHQYEKQYRDFSEILRENYYMTQ